MFGFFAHALLPECLQDREDHRSYKKTNDSEGFESPQNAQKNQDERHLGRPSDENRFYHVLNTPHHQRVPDEKQDEGQRSSLGQKGEGGRKPDGHRTHREKRQEKEQKGEEKSVRNPRHLEADSGQDRLRQGCEKHAVDDPPGHRSDLPEWPFHCRPPPI